MKLNLKDIEIKRVLKKAPGHALNLTGIVTKVNEIRSEKGLDEVGLKTVKDALIKLVKEGVLTIQYALNMASED